MVSHAVEHRQRLVVRVDGNRNLSALDTSDFGSHFLNFHAAFACTVWATVSKDYRDDWSPRAKFVRLPGPVSFPQIIHILDFETSSFRRELVRASLTVLVCQITCRAFRGRLSWARYWQAFSRHLSSGCRRGFHRIRSIGVRRRSVRYLRRPGSRER